MQRNDSGIFRGTALVIQLGSGHNLTQDSDFVFKQITDMEQTLQVSQSLQSERSYGRLFWGFAFLHFVVWLVLPLLTKPNYPLDVIECYIYGQEWALASSKHPPLPSWVVAFLDLLTNRWSAVPYLASQIFVFFAFWANWKLASAMFSAKKALLAVALMELYTYYTFYGLEFNNNTSLIGCWALASSAFYFAVTQGKLRFWLATGLFLGLAVMAKYTGFVLIVLLVAFTIYEPKARKCWKTPGPYLVTLIAALLFLPHFLVVYQSDFATLGYVQDRFEDGIQDSGGYITFPLRFLVTQLGIVAPILCGFVLFCGGKLRFRRRDDEERFNARFLLFLVAFPLVAQLLGSLIFHVKLSTAYGSHIWIFLGVFLVFFFNVRETLLTRKRLFAFFLLAMTLMVALTVFRDVASPYLRHKPSRVHYPGREIARIAEETWRQRYTTPCPQLVGEWWLSGQVVAYGKDRPTVFCYVFPDSYVEGKVLSLWSSPKDAAREGGLCLWDCNHYPEGVPPLLLKEYPNAEILAPIEIPFSTGADLPPLRLGIAVIPQ